MERQAIVRAGRRKKRKKRNKEPCQTNLQLPFKSPFQSFVNAGFQMEEKNTGKPLIFSSALLARSNSLIPFSWKIRDTQDVQSQCGGPGLCGDSHYG